MLIEEAVILLIGAVALATSAAAQSTPPPAAITRTVIAATKLPSVTDVPLYFRAVSVTFPRARRVASLRPTASSIRCRDRPRLRSMIRQQH